MYFQLEPFAVCTHASTGAARRAGARYPASMGQGQSSDRDGDRGECWIRERERRVQLVSSRAKEGGETAAPSQRA
jgi:hypothetical protein